MAVVYDANCSARLSFLKTVLLCPHRALLAARGRCLGVVSRGRSWWLRPGFSCGGFSRRRAQAAGVCVAIAVARARVSCCAAYGIRPEQGLNARPLRGQVDSHSLCHRGSPASPLANSIVLRA